MNNLIPYILQFALIAACLVAIVFLLKCWAHGFRRNRGHLQLVNVAEGTHEGSKRYLADAAVATRYLLGKKGTDADHIAICGAADEPIVVITDEATAAEKEVTGEFLATAKRTLPMVGSEAITADEDVYTAANGKVQDEPAAAGTYFKVGRARTACGGDGQQLEVIPCPPEKLVVVAELTAPDTANGSDAGTTQTLANALKADLVALETALATPAKIKLLNS